MIAHKFKITNPQDYGLVLLCDGEGQCQLLDWRFCHSISVPPSSAMLFLSCGSVDWPLLVVYLCMFLSNVLLVWYVCVFVLNVLSWRGLHVLLFVFTCVGIEWVCLC